MKFNTSKKAISSMSIRKLIWEYKNRFTTKEIISSFILLFMKQNGIESNLINSTHECKIYHESYNDCLYAKISSSFPGISLKDIESVFENLIDLDRKKSEGVVYTPNYIIDFIINYSLSLYNDDIPPILCDPSCGSGGFLIRAIEILSRKFDLDPTTVFQNHIRGIDINQEAVSCAKTIVELYFLFNRKKPPTLEKNIICDDTLLTKKNELISRLVCKKDGFDLIVTNPPYVKLQNIDTEYRERLINAYYNYTTGSFSLAMLFLIAGHNLLSPRGVLGYITQNNIFTSLAGENVRKYLANNNILHTIIDFGHNKVFADASAYTCLLFLTNERNDELLFKNCINPKRELSRFQDAQDFSPIPILTLNSKKWRLAPLKHLDNLRILETRGTPLGELAEIRVGFATLKDSIFFLNVNSGSNFDIEHEITRQAIKIANLTDQASVSTHIGRIIHPYKKVGNRWIPLEPDEFMKRYPKAYRYLEANKEVLLKRDKGKGQFNYFYEWGRTQGMEAPGPKLLTKTFNKGPGFLLDVSDSLFCNGYSVKPLNGANLFYKNISIEVLQKILNSIVMNYYTKLTSFQIDGNYQCFQKNFIEKLCIPELTQSDLLEIREGQGLHLDKLICEMFSLCYEDLVEITKL